MKMQIDVITYEQERLNYFTSLMEKIQNKYDRLYKKFGQSPYLSDEITLLSDVGRKLSFYKDVVEMLEKVYCKPSEGKWEIVLGSNRKEKMVCTNCRHQQDLANTFTYCPNCGARMRGNK